MIYLKGNDIIPLILLYLRLECGNKNRMISFNKEDSI